MAAQKKSGLGKGLGALMSSNDIPQENNVLEVDINKITPNKSQPRNVFNDASLNELAQSIEEMGIIQPLTVKRVDDYYEIVAGERRWRAARIAGLKKVPVIVKEYDDLKSLEAALIENIQREDLNPMEEAFTYIRFSNEFGMNQEEIAKKVGKSRSAVANAMRLANLDKRVQVFVKEYKLTNGHARALLALDDGNIQFEMAEKIIDEDLSVRVTEDLVKVTVENMNKPQAVEEKKVIRNPEVARECMRIAKELRSIFGTKVNVKNNKNKGKIEIEYNSIDDLDRIVGLIKEKMQN